MSAPPKNREELETYLEVVRDLAFDTIHDRPDNAPLPTLAQQTANRETLLIYLNSTIALELMRANP